MSAKLSLDNIIFFMQTFLMPTKKSTRNRKTTSARSTRSLPSDQTLSYETKLIIVVLLLLFFYPVGLVFMWLWMGKWPLLLRIIITLPVFLGLGAFFMLMVLFASAFNRMRFTRTRYMQPYMMQITPAPSTQQATPPANPYTY